MSSCCGLYKKCRYCHENVWYSKTLKPCNCNAPLCQDCIGKYVVEIGKTCRECTEEFRFKIKVKRIVKPVINEKLTKEQKMAYNILIDLSIIFFIAIDYFIGVFFMINGYNDQADIMIYHLVYLQIVLVLTWIFRFVYIFNIKTIKH